MKRNFTLVFIMLQAFLLSLSAQTVLNSISNQMHQGDVLNLKRIDTISPGNAGANQVWDFSNAEILEDFVIKYNGDAAKTNSQNANYFACDENGSKVSYFKSTANQLLYSGITTEKVKIDFPNPITEMVYPFEYGAEIKGEMNGTYTANQFSVPVTGSYITKADAWGTLILPSGVTLKNVLRVKSLRDYTHESSGSDYHFTINRYAFYAPGQRYPVLQIREVDFDCVNCACDGKEYKAYFNASIKNESADNSIKNPGFKYKAYPNPFENELKLEYEIKAKASLKFSLVDMGGREVKKLLNTNQEAGSYNITTDMTEFRATTFILRMYVNDVLYTEKLIKKESCNKH